MALINSRLKHFLAVLGPGIVVMLADTDAGSVITAAQSGAQWGYKLLLLQVVLIPILFIAQELTVRLGLVTGKGHGELIRETFGFPAALLSVSTMALACIGALVTEFSGMAGIGMLYGVPAWITMLLAAGGLILIVWTGSYRSVERVAMLFGAFELAFLIVAWKAHPSAAEILESARLMPVHHSGFNYLIAANIGAVVMPWMIFYQQSAVIDKGLDEQDLPAARWDTIVGAVATQVVMASVLISVAATGHHDILNTVDEIADSITPVLGETSGKMLFGLGMMGAAMVAAIVVSLTAAWGVGEILGFKRSLDHKPGEAPWFYGIFTLSVIVSAVIVASRINLVKLSIAIEVMNALLLPIVLGFLYLLARKSLPESHRLKGGYSWIVAIVLGSTSMMGVYGALTGIFG